MPGGRPVFLLGSGWPQPSCGRAQENGPSHQAPQAGSPAHSAPGRGACTRVRGRLPLLPGPGSGGGTEAQASGGSRSLPRHAERACFSCSPCSKQEGSSAWGWAREPLRGGRGWPGGGLSPAQGQRILGKPGLGLAGQWAQGSCPAQGRPLHANTWTPFSCLQSAHPCWPGASQLKFS